MQPLKLSVTQHPVWCHTTAATQQCITPRLLHFGEEANGLTEFTGMLDSGGGMQVEQGRTKMQSSAFVSDMTMKDKQIHTEHFMWAEKQKKKQLCYLLSFRI